MLEFNLVFNLTAIINCTLMILWYFHQKRIPLKSYSFFLRFNIYVLISTAVNTIADVLYEIEVVDEIGFNYILALYSFMISFILVVYADFICEYMNLYENKKKIIKYFFYFILICTTVIDFITPETKAGFYFSRSGYSTGKLGTIYIFLSAVLVVSEIAVIIYRRKSVPAFNVFILILGIVFSTAMLMVQYKFSVSLLGFAFSIVCLSLYNYIFNPALYMDNLTNLNNKDCMRNYLDYRFGRDKKFAVIFLAMDDFKYINKTYGVDVGDNLLVQVGHYLETVDEVDDVFAYGSDKFAAICNKKNIEDIKVVSENIQNRFRHPWYSDSHSGIMMSASICCFECPKDAQDYGSLIEMIDYAMSLAKKTNKGGISIAGDMDLSKMRCEKEIEKAVRLAIDRNELLVYYQPIFSVEKNRYNSAEALVRLNDEKLGWISPEEFIPIAEKNGLIIALGDCVLRSVCKFIRDNNLLESPVEYIEVNMSPVQLQQPEYYKKIISILEEYDVKPSQINIEITETANMAGGSDTVNDNIRHIVDYGITLSLDDYGSGYSNLDYINHMPFNIIKIDKFIVWDAFQNSKAGITLEYTIRMLNALSYNIVAEGVETAEQKEHLANIGCHYMQGWYYSKAVSGDEFMKVIDMAS